MWHGEPDEASADASEAAGAYETIWYRWSLSPGAAPLRFTSTTLRTFVGDIQPCDGLCNA